MREEQDIRIDSKLDSPLTLADLPSRYVNRGILAQGGMGFVYRAFDRNLERDVAIKILVVSDAPNKNELKDRFTREAKVLSSLDHPNIVKLLDWGETAEGYPFLAMEYLDGVSLSAELGRSKTLSLQRFHALCSAVLAGLEHAHSLGIVHRDLKPSNIMICDVENDTPVVKLIDFGIVRFESPEESYDGNVTVTVTATNDRLGSPAYMSPEQCLGNPASKLSDLYSFGCVMFECLSGEHPLRADSVFDYMQKHVNSLPPKLLVEPANDEGSALADLIDQCLSKNAVQRPSSALKLRESIEKIFQNKRIETCRFFLPGSVSQGKKRNSSSFRLLALIAGLSCLAAACLIISKQQQQRLRDSVEFKINKHLEASQKSTLLLNDAVALASRWRQRFQSSKTQADKVKTADVLLDKLLDLARIQREAGHLQEAESDLSEGVELCQVLGAEADGRKSLCLDGIGTLKAIQNKPREGLTYELKAQTLANSVWGEGHWRALNISFNLIKIELALKNLDDATPLIQRALVLYSVQPRAYNSHRKIVSGIDRAKELDKLLREIRGLSPDEDVQRKKLLALLADWLKNFA
jgi:serine/threonine protein kinase